MGAQVTSNKPFRLVCFAAFMATLFIYSPNVMTLFSFDGFEMTGLFAEPCLISTFAASCALIAAELFGATALVERLLSLRFARPVCGAAYLLSNAGFVACITAQLPVASSVLGPCAVVSGVSVVGMCLMWASAFRDASLFEALLVAVVGLLSSAVVHNIVSILVWPAALSVELALLAIGTAPLLLANASNASDMNEGIRPGPAETESDASAGMERDDGKAGGSKCAGFSCGAFLSIMGVPLMGMAISSFAIGVRPFYILDGSVNVEVLGMYVAVVLALPLVLLRSKEPFFSFLYQIYLPILTAVLTTLAVVFATGLLHELALVCLSAFFTLVTVVAIASSTAISNANEFPRRMVFATLIAVYSGFAIFGIGMGARSSELFNNSQSFLLVLSVVYACAMLVGSSVRIWKTTVSSFQDDALQAERKEAPGDGSDGVGHVETFEERLAKISQLGGLSARETEIASYVGRGHTSVYVAKTLLISDSTVYTHVRNIYRKLGITSREELIQLFNAPEMQGEVGE